MFINELPRVLVSTNSLYRRLYQSLQSAHRIAIDVETSGDEPEDALNPWRGFLVGVGFGIDHYLSKRETFYLPMHVDNKDYEGKIFTNADLDNLLQNAAPRNALWLMHNAKFDLKWLELATSYRWDDMDYLDDPMVQMWMINSSEPKGLKDLTTKFYSGEPEPVKFEKLLGVGKNKKKLEQLDPEIIADYCCADVRNTLRVWEKTNQLLAEQPETVRHVYRYIEKPVLRLLADMELRGAQLDSDKLYTLAVRVQELIEETDRELQSYADINWNSPQQVVQILKAHGVVLPEDKTTATGKQKLDAEVLDMLSDTSPIVTTLKTNKGLKKVYKTYIMAYYRRSDKDFRVHAEFRQTGTRTGRLSCGEPNLQNIPRPRKAKPGEMLSELDQIYTTLRQLLIANTDYDPRRPMFVADLSQIELRMAAHFSNDPALVDAYANDKDIHQITADAISGGNRQVAKSVNFGYLYGIGPRKLMLGVNCTLNEAKVFLARYEKQFAVLKLWTQRVQSQARMNGYVTTIMGRRRYLPDLKSADWSKAGAASRQAVNTLVQGSAADYLKIAMIDIDTLLRKPYGVHLILQVHDELVWDCDRPLTKKEIAEVCDIIRYEMENAIGLKVPVRTEPLVVMNWAEAK